MLRKLRGWRGASEIELLFYKGVQKSSKKVLPTNSKKASGAEAMKPGFLGQKSAVGLHVENGPELRGGPLLLLVLARPGVVVQQLAAA